VPAFSSGGVSGFLHAAAGAPGRGLALTHGAGSNSNSLLLVKVAEALAGAGVSVLRFDLPFRQARRQGPPWPAQAAEDREGMRRAVLALGQAGYAPVAMGGHSYGGRQASLLAAEEPELAAALLLLSYPLHPPGKPDRLRTAHFPKLRAPALFVHGARDPFGSLAEIEAALVLIAGQAELLAVEGAGHELGGMDAQEVARRFQANPWSSASGAGSR